MTLSATYNLSATMPRGVSTSPSAGGSRLVATALGLAISVLCPGQGFGIWSPILVGVFVLEHGLPNPIVKNKTNHTCCSRL